jgi:hypothetical protein
MVHKQAWSIKNYRYIGDVSENYSLLIMGVSNVDGDDGGVYGDGSGGNSPSR